MNTPENILNTQNDVTIKKKNVVKSKKNVRSLTDEEYEEIFAAVLKNATEEEVKSEDTESDAEVPNNAVIDAVEGRHANILHPLQIQNEVTPGPSDDEKPLAVPPSPVKKKKHIAGKARLLPKQLKYSSTEGKRLSQLPSAPSRKDIKTLKDRMLALQSLRIEDNDGTWVQCCNSKCNKWRYLDDIKEPYQVPQDWYCFMNKDEERNSCEKPEEDYTELSFVYNRFAVGSIVWAKIAGYSWWPGIIDDDPDEEKFFWTNGYSDIPTHYHVVFLDESVSRAWIPNIFVKPFTEENKQQQEATQKNAKDQMLFESAIKTATEALNMSLKERLDRFSFVARYKGKWPSAKSCNESKPLIKKKQTGQNSFEKSKNDDIINDLSDAENLLNELDDESISSLLDYELKEDWKSLPSSPSSNFSVKQKPNQIANLKKKKKHSIKEKQNDSSCKNILNEKNNQNKVTKGKLSKDTADKHNNKKIETKKAHSKKLKLESKISNQNKNSTGKKVTEKSKTMHAKKIKPKFSSVPKSTVTNSQKRTENINSIALPNKKQNIEQNNMKEEKQLEISTVKTNMKKEVENCNNENQNFNSNSVSEKKVKQKLFKPPKLPKSEKVTDSTKKDQKLEKSEKEQNRILDSTTEVEVKATAVTLESFVSEDENSQKSLPFDTEE